jgi:NAD(P)-dependent dehydrogenase (short-subunit alcohol dehydrogenase family)
VVLITGAAGGIGRALAAEWASRGADLVLADVAVDALVGGPRALVVRCDVTDPAACEAALAEALGRFGRLDVLVNNAGITHRSLFAATDPEVIRRVVEVNFFGSVNMTRAALPALTDSRGHIAVLSSVAGFAPLLGRTGYAASKHALHGFFESLREELRDVGVGVSMICPSFVDTPLRDNASDGAGGRVKDKGALAGGMLDAASVARIVADAVQARRRTVPISAVARASWVLSRVAPRAYAAIMRRNQRREFVAGA